MKPPLKTLFVTSPFGTVGSQWQFNRHMGVDLRASVGTPLYAPEDGTINERYIGSKGILVLGLAGTKWHRFLHLSKFSVALGAKVKAGQLIGHTGNTGQVAAHLHWDVRKPNTLWSASFSNYYDPMKLIKEEEDEMLTNRAHFITMYEQTRGKKPSEATINSYVGKKTYAYTWGKLHGEVINLPKLVSENAKLKTDLTACQAGTGVNKTSVIKYVQEKLT